MTWMAAESAMAGGSASWVFDTLWATSLLMLLVLVIRRPIARTFGPGIAYALWLIPFARLFMPSLTRTITVEAEPLQTVPSTLPTAPSLTGDDTALVTASLSDTPVMALTDNVQVGAVSPGVSYAEQTGAWIDQLLASANWTSIALTVWACGAAIFLVSQLAAYLQNRRELLDDAVVVDRIGSIEVIEIAGISGPFAFGLWKRYIALPIGFDRHYDPVERTLALEHESAHHRAGDLWANFAALTMLSIHWFNPIAWLSWRAFRFDQEAACDARVIRRRGARERNAYARAIAKAATGQTLAFASPLNPKDKIVERLKMLNQKEHSPARKRFGGALIATGMVSALALTASVSYAIQSVEPPQPPEAPMTPESVPLPPSAPAAPEAPEAPEPGEIKREVRVIKVIGEDGKTVVLRGDEGASEAEIEAMVAKAEKMAQESLANASETERRAKRVVIHKRSQGEDVIKFDDGREMRIKINDCDTDAKDKGQAFMTQSETKDGKVIRNKIVTCKEIMPDMAAISGQIERAMLDAEKQMKFARVEVLRSKDIPEGDRAEALRELDEGIEEMRRELDAARRELQQLRIERDALLREKN